MQENRKILVPLKEREEAKSRYDANNAKKQEINRKIDSIQKEVEAKEAEIKDLEKQHSALYSENGNLAMKFSKLEVGYYYKVEQHWGGMTYMFTVKCLNNDVYIDPQFKWDVILGEGEIISISESAPWKVGEKIDMYYSCTDQQAFELAQKTILKPKGS